MNATRSHDNLLAFTLIELLVVVAILSVLLAILLPALQGVRSLAYRSRCMGHLRSIAIGWITYAEDNRGTFLLLGVGANPEFEFGGWPGDGYAKYRPLNPYVQLGLDANSASETEARVFRCPADTGDEDYPVPYYKELGNSYRANTALGCSGGVSESIKEPWRTINREINSRFQGLLCTNVPDTTTMLLVGDYNWLTQIDPMWTMCAKSWHGQRHRYNLAFLDGHAGDIRIRKGIYFEQGTYRWQPFKSIDDTVLALQKPVPCRCGQP